MDPISNTAPRISSLPGTTVITKTENELPTPALQPGPTVASPTNALTAIVVRGMFESAQNTGAKPTKVDTTERTLKPYGIGMLPEGPKEAAERARAEQQNGQGPPD